MWRRLAEACQMTHPCVHSRRLSTTDSIQFAVITCWTITVALIDDEWRADYNRSADEYLAGSVR